MNSDHKFCILSVKYEITERIDDAEGAIKTTEMEHIFVARKKDVLLKKIRNFENRLRNKKETGPTPLLTRIRNGFIGYLLKYKHSYNALLRL